ncbi:MAG: hypothetical protein WCP08_09680 [Prolixibacteraceae bacterium]
MTNRKFYWFLVFGLLVSASLFAQESIPKNPNSERIRGTRFIPYPNYSGKPYLNDKFIMGEIELNDGTKIANIGLNYSTYRDELIYYNSSVSAQVQIDKISLNGFSLPDKYGKKRVFHRQYCGGSLHGECYFEVLCEGKISLLAYRKVNLESCDTYYSKSGLAYQPGYLYFLYSAEKGYSPVNLTRKSLLSKFNKPNQKLVKKLLRKNGVMLTDEPGFVKAWDLILDNGITLNI